MTNRTLGLSALCALLLLSLVACGSSSDGGANAPSAGEAPAAAKLVHPKQEDLSRYMPKENRQKVSLLEGNLFELDTLPAATLANYSKGGKSFEQFLFRTQSTAMAGVYLAYVKDAMANPKFVAGFGGYFGEIDGKPVFAFVKNEYVTGLVGLSQADADAEGRIIAGRIP